MTYFKDLFSLMASVDVAVFDSVYELLNVLIIITLLQFG